MKKEKQLGEVLDFTSKTLFDRDGIKSLTGPCIAKLPFEFGWLDYDEKPFKWAIVNVVKVKLPKDYTIEDECAYETGQHIFIKSKHSRKVLEFNFNPGLGVFKFFDGEMNTDTFVEDFTYAVETNPNI